MTARAPLAWSSSAVNVRPRNGVTPSRGNRRLSMTSQGSSSAPALPVSTHEAPVNAASPSNAFVRSRHAITSTAADGVVPPAARRVLLQDRDEPFRVAVRQRLQQHRVDGREDGGRRADPEREREDGRRREGAVLDQRADREADVLPRVAEPWRDPDVAGALLRQLDVAERAARRVAGLARLETRVLEVALLHRAVELQLLGEIRFEAIALQRVAAAGGRARASTREPSFGEVEDAVDGQDHPVEFAALERRPGAVRPA